MAFEKDFKDPVKLKNGAVMISTRYSRFEAAEKISQSVGFEIGPFELIECSVRFGIVPSNEVRDFSGPRWHSCLDDGAGVKQVWVYARDEK